ncbi:hypothetical protein V1477_008871 [Vespula maculifrons]|uniref:Uncharacterized protein n=1 Tax=Vespula maculifrons TaxID=7453 RepID=A0ABD2CE92_VESMC
MEPTHDIFSEVSCWCEYARASKQASKEASKQVSKRASEQASKPGFKQAHPSFLLPGLLSAQRCGRNRLTQLNETSNLKRACRGYEFMYETKTPAIVCPFRLILNGY